jgi:acetyl esterase/lipase
VGFPSWARDAPQRLLYGSNAGGKWELYAWDRERETHRQVTDRPEGTLRGALDPAGERIWWFDDRAGDELGHWVVVPFAGGEGRRAAPELPPAYDRGLALGRSLAVLGRSVEGGVTVEILEGEGPARRLYAHREQATLGGLSRDETLLCLAHSERGDSLHWALRVLDLQGTTLGELWDGPGRGLHPSGWSPVPGDQRLLVGHERGELPRPMIWDLSDGTVTDLAESVALPGEVSASWYPDATAVLLAHDFRGRTELYRLDLATRALERLETELGTITQARVRPDGEVWYAWSAAATPPEVRAGRRRLLRPAGDPAPAGVPYTDHEVEGIHVFLAEPAGDGGRPWPMVVQVHGGPTAHDRDAFSPRVQAWVDHGLAVVLVNYRGSTGYGRAWRDALIGNPGLTELEDLAKVHDWLVREGIADPRRIVLAGGSWGGYLTLLGLSLQPERWALGLAAVPVADSVAAYEDAMEPLKAFDRALFGGPPDVIPEVYAARSPITYIDRVRVPVHILAGEHDPRCPIRQIDNYLARLRELGLAHEVYRYDAGHGSLVAEEMVRQMEQWLDFTARHLGMSPPA